jgi:hypothetical protein
MEEQLISKKELLEHTGISYGQLYRWKRMDIIPESWFIKKSSFTGQETFFPREKILERVKKIIELKDEYSLEDLAKFFSPNPSEVELTLEDLQTHSILDSETILFYQSLNEKSKSLHFGDVLYLFICEWLYKYKNIPIAHAFNQLTFIRNLDIKKNNDLSFELLAIKKNQEVIWLLTSTVAPIIIEDGASLDIRVNIDEKLNELKISLSEIKQRRIKG